MIDCEPRVVQLEAISRSLLGFRSGDGLDEQYDPVFFRNGVATGWAHFMEMRLGKTPVALNEFAYLRAHSGINKAVIIAPNKFKFGWGNEVEKFMPGQRVHVHEGGGANKDTLKALSRDDGIVVFNYEFTRSADMIAAAAEFVRGGIAIADESVQIKGNSSTFFKGSLAVAKEAAFRRILTGKPVVQGPQDLWAQGRFIGEFDGFNYFAYRGRYCKMGGFKGKQIVSFLREDELEERVARWAFKARKVDWLKTPGVDYSEEYLQVDGDQRDAYRTMQEDMILYIGEDTATAEMVITKLNKLQQISSGFIIDDDRNVRWLVQPDRNPKLLWLKEKLKNEITTKTIVCCAFNASVDLLIKELAPFGVNVIRGGKEYDTEAEKAQFNADPNKRVMIVTKAAKYGQTLMGNKDDPCLTTIFYENSYSLDDRAQLEERNQGEGQLGPINIIDPIVTHADLRPLEALRNKEDVAAVLLGYDRNTGILPRPV